MKKKYFIFLIVGLTIGVAAYFFWQRQAKTNVLATSDNKPNTYTVKKTKLTETLTLSGEIDADEHVSLFFPTGGKLAWVGVKEGDYVKKYQGIASVDQRDLEKRLQASLNSYMITRWDFEQSKVDNKDAAIKDGDVGDKLKRIIDKAQFNLDNSVINVEIASLAKEMAYMYSPIEGIVTKVGGQYAGANIAATGTFEIVNPQTIFFSAIADQTDIPLLSVGETAVITLDPYESEKITGVVKSIAFTPVVGDTGTTYEVKIDFTSSNDLLKYRLGMTGDAEFVTKEKIGIIAVPASFVKTILKKKYVYILKDGKEVQTEVKVGDEGDSDIEIKNGLSEGDIIVEK